MNDDEVLCRVTWTVADVRMAYERKYGHKATNEEIEEFINNISWKRVEEVGIEYGWEIIDAAI